MSRFLRTVSRGVAAACAAATGTSTAFCDKKKDSPPPKSVAEIIMSLATKGRHVFVNGRVDDDLARTVIATLMCTCALSPSNAGRPLRDISAGTHLYPSHLDTFRPTLL